MFLKLTFCAKTKLWYFSHKKIDVQEGLVTYSSSHS